MNDGRPKVTEQEATRLRHQELYWQRLVYLKVSSAYIRRYRDRLRRWVTAVQAVNAIASSGGIAGWLVWKDYALIWAALIASAQVLDALKGVFPVSKTHTAASEYANALEALFIDAQLEWESVISGELTSGEIALRWHNLQKRQHKLETRCFPKGLETKCQLMEAAEHESRAFFARSYGVIG